MPKTYSYDPACESLAEYFLGTVRKHEDVQDLAQHIQSAVEDWLFDQERRAEPCLSEAEQKAQATRCGCRGADDLCVCQNAPDATTRAARKAGVPA